MLRSLTLVALAAVLAAGCGGDRKTRPAATSSGSLTLKACGLTAPPPPPPPPPTK